MVTGTTISSTWANNTLSDLATALTNSIAKDGQTTPTANLPMGGFKLTGLGTGSAATDSANLTQIQAQAYIYLGSVAGTDTITGTTSPVTTAYAAGQTYRFVAAASNTGAATININSLGAKSITKDGTNALVAGDIKSGGLYQVTYDGTQFQLANSSAVTSASLANSAIGVAMINGTLTASVAASALTVAIKTKAGTDPSASDPVIVYFRNVTEATGDYTVLSLTAATSLVISSGSTLGTTSGAASRLWVVGFNDGGTFRLGVSNITTSQSIGDDVIASSTAEGGAGGADSANTFYTGSAVTSKAMRVLGYVESTQATAGTWATSPSKIQMVSNIYSTVPPASASRLVIGTAVATTSGTSHDFTGIPSWVRRITFSWSGGSTSGTSTPILQLGDSGGIETTTYLNGTATVVNAGATVGNNSTSGFLLAGSTAGTVILHITAVLTLVDPANNTWEFSISGGRSDAGNAITGGGSKSLSATLTQFRLTTAGGTDTFDAGTANYLYE